MYDNKDYVNFQGSSILASQFLVAGLCDKIVSQLEPIYAIWFQSHARTITAAGTIVNRKLNLAIANVI
jgi:hypothetical protein